VDKNLSKLTIIDFNVAKRVSDDDPFLMYTRSTGALAYAAPERLREKCVYTEKVDTWACGIILFMLLSGKHPFDTESSIVQLMQEIIRGEDLARE
jgi:serine/threonine protein kinase